MTIILTFQLIFLIKEIVSCTTLLKHYLVRFVNIFVAILLWFFCASYLIGYIIIVCWLKRSAFTILTLSNTSNILLIRLFHKSISEFVYFSLQSIGLYVFLFIYKKLCLVKFLMLIQLFLLLLFIYMLLLHFRILSYNKIYYALYQILF